MTSMAATMTPMVDEAQGMARTQQPAPEGLASVERLHATLTEIRRRCPTLPVLAIHWMHVKHPIHPVQDELMAQETDASPAALPRYGALLAAFAVCLLYAGYLTARMAQLRWSLRRPLAALRRERFDVVAKTWCFDATRSSNGRDFYYGDLQQRLARRGVRMLLICGDARGKGWLRFAQGNISTEDARWQAPEWCLAPLSAPWAMAWRQLLSALRLRRMAAQEQRPFIKRVMARASRACVSRQIMPVGLNAWMTGAVVKCWHPRAFVTLYEGHGWERCAWWGAKAADPACRTVGYQHTILLRHNRALVGTPLADDPAARPDAALCLGPRTVVMLRPSHPRSTMIPFGTFRATPDRSAVVPPAPQRRTVIVLPEGYVGESALLFNAALEAAQRLPDHRFILRLHPILPLEQVRPHLTQDPAGLANVEISPGRPIEGDFARASAVLYRGSSSVLYAVAYGLKPVYLRDARQHEIDPLFELDGWRERAGSAEHAAAMLTGYAQTDPVAAADAWRPAAEYVGGYTVPVSDASVDQFLRLIGVTTGAAAP